jgi:Leucine-rich repeat (LRR) protein
MSQRLDVTEIKPNLARTGIVLVEFSSREADGVLTLLPAARMDERRVPWEPTAGRNAHVPFASPPSKSVGATERGEHVCEYTRGARRVRRRREGPSFDSLDDDVIVAIGRVLANPLLPDLCCFASASRCLRAALTGVMFDEHMRHRGDARSLVRKAGSTLGWLAQTRILAWPQKGLDAADCAVLASIIRSGALPQLTELSLPDNMIGDVGVQMIAEACAGGALQLSTLCLSNNDIGDEGVQVLAGALASGALPQLTDLNLSGNCIGDAGALALAAAFASSRLRAQLKNIVVRYNEIGYAGSLALVTVLANGLAGPARKLTFKYGFLYGNDPISFAVNKQAFVSECIQLVPLPLLFWVLNLYRFV